LDRDGRDISGRSFFWELTVRHVGDDLKLLFRLFFNLFFSRRSICFDACGRR
jgi:hypothetical protein